MLLPKPCLPTDSREKASDMGISSWIALTGIEGILLLIENITQQLQVLFKQKPKKNMVKVPGN